MTGPSNDNDDPNGLSWSWEDWDWWSIALVAGAVCGPIALAWHVVEAVL